MAFGSDEVLHFYVEMEQKQCGHPCNVVESSTQTPNTPIFEMQCFHILCYHMMDHPKHWTSF